MGNTPETHVTGPVGYCAHVRNVRVVEIETARVAPEVQLMAQGFDAARVAALKTQCRAGILQLHRIARMCEDVLKTG